MKLFLLFILLCGINWTPKHTVKTKKVCTATCTETASSDVMMVPSGLLFQF